MKEITVQDLLTRIPHSSVQGSLNRCIAGITCSSSEAREGWLFAALKGFKRDGRDFVPDALARGVRTVLSHAGPQGTPPEGVTWIVCPRDREAYSRACAAFFGTDSLRVKVAGITGTNGKTTVAYLLRRIFSEEGPSGLLGTIEYDDGSGLRPAPRTTPEAHEVHAFLAALDARGARCCAMEVSSHALALHRVRDVPFEVAAFTNLSRDHLDFHKTLEAYYQTKRRFFDLLVTGGTAVLNLENPYGVRLLQEMSGKKVLRVGNGPPAEIYPLECHIGLEGIEMALASPAGEIGIKSPLTGDFNRQNILVAVASAISMGVSREKIASGIGRLSGVPGRLERVDAGQPFAVFVDYAHTDDGLKNVLSALRGLTSGRLRVVFGCGGDRDRSKRPLMGAVVARLADEVFLTSDNPRTEDPGAILKDAESGVRPELSEGKGFCKIENRREAIRQALLGAGPDDIVVVAGKGHERDQQIGTDRFPFHDPTVVREILGELGWPG